MFIVHGGRWQHLFYIQSTILVKNMSSAIHNAVSFGWDNFFDDGEMSNLPKYYFRLESETSHTSEEDTESVCSLQAKETDTVRDTSDTETRTDSELELEIEYEVASDTDVESLVISSSSEEEMVLAATAAVCNTSVEAYITDCEESDTSSTEEPKFTRKDFSTCIRCKGSNDNPSYRYCEKCFQDRKTFFPPRPRRRRSRPNRKKSPIKLSAVKSCLKGLSQDSGIGLSQECPVLNLDQIVVGNQATSTVSSSQCTVSAEDLSQPSVSGLSTVSKGDIQGSVPSASAGTSRLRKRVFSESSLSDSDLSEQPKAKQLKVERAQSASGFNRDDHTSDLGSSQNSLMNEASSSAGSVNTLKTSQSELCIVCNTSPKNGIFLHGSIAHMCCCYQCAIRTWRTIKRCPICRRKINNVVKLYAS